MKNILQFKLWKKPKMRNKVHSCQTEWQIEKANERAVAKTFLEGLQWIHDNTMMNSVHDINNGTHEYPIGILPHLNAAESIVHSINWQLMELIVTFIATQIIDSFRGEECTLKHRIIKIIKKTITWLVVTMYTWMMTIDMATKLIALFAIIDD